MLFKLQAPKAKDPLQKPNRTPESKPVRRVPGRQKRRLNEVGDYFFLAPIMLLKLLGLYSPSLALSLRVNSGIEPNLPPLTILRRSEKFQGQRITSDYLLLMPLSHSPPPSLLEEPACPRLSCPPN